VFVSIGKCCLKVVDDGKFLFVLFTEMNVCLFIVLKIRSYLALLGFAISLWLR